MSVRCGNHPRGSKVNHPTADDVRECYAGRYHEEAEAKAEQEAEKRSERFWEERGAGEDDRIEREAWAREDEAREAANRPDDLIGALEASVREKRFIDEEEAERAASVLDGMTGSHGRDMASAAQIDYAMDLLKTRRWPDKLSRADIENMERRQVSKLIDGLKKAKVIPGTKTVLMADDWKEVPAGRYAFVTPGDDGVSYSYVDRQDLNPPRERSVRFYEVSLPTKPMWKGRIFVAQLFGSPGDYRKEPRRGDAAKAILEMIAKDPREAAATFGKETQHCGRCMSPLTHARSRAAGYGQKCASVMGWEW